MKIARFEAGMRRISAAASSSSPRGRASEGPSNLTHCRFPVLPFNREKKEKVDVVEVVVRGVRRGGCGWWVCGWVLTLHSRMRSTFFGILNNNCTSLRGEDAALAPFSGAVPGAKN